MADYNFNKEVKRYSYLFPSSKRPWIGDLEMYRVNQFGYTTNILDDLQQPDFNVKNVLSDVKDQFPEGIQNTKAFAEALTQWEKEDINFDEYFKRECEGGYKESTLFKYMQGLIAHLEDTTSKLNYWEMQKTISNSKYTNCVKKFPRTRRDKFDEEVKRYLYLFPSSKRPWIGDDELYRVDAYLYRKCNILDYLEHPDFDIKNVLSYVKEMFPKGIENLNAFAQALTQWEKEDVDIDSYYVNQCRKWDSKLLEYIKELIVHMQKNTPNIDFWHMINILEGSPFISEIIILMHDNTEEEYWENMTNLFYHEYEYEDSME